MLCRSDVSGMRVLSGLRASVESFPLEGAFPTAASSARYDPPSADGGRARCPSCSACRGPWSPTTRRFQPWSVSGFPLPGLRSWRPDAVAAPGEERLGPPTCFAASLPACHGLRTPADLHLLATTAALVWPAVCVKTLGVRHTRLCEAVPALQGARSPLRPPGYAVSASPLVFAVSPRLRHGRKTRYGWMATPYPTGTFTLPETPSFLGAITLALSCCRKPQRRKGVGSGCVALRHVSPIPPLEPYVQLLPHTAHEIGTFMVTSISPGFHHIHGGQLARSLGTFVPFPDPIPQGLRHVCGFPTLRLLCPI
jgi:hypothetical protein